MFVDTVTRKEKIPMADFTAYSIENAPEDSKPFLEGANAKFGFTPNLLAVMAESPTALKAYMTVAGLVEETDFDGTEQQIILMTTSFENGCTYCMAAHSTVSHMTGVPADVIGSLRAGTPIADPKLNALAVFVRALVQNGGNADAESTEAFFAAGYTKKQALDLLVPVAQKIISNFTNFIASTPKDEAFAAQAWEKPAVSA